MATRFTVLVVCVGNVCRSPLAERILRLRLAAVLGEDADALVSVSSAGVMALVGEPMDASAHEQLQRLGGSAEGFHARQLDPRSVAQADLVLTATLALRSRVLEEAPRALKRTFTIRELAGLVEADVDRDLPLTGPVELVARAASWRGAVGIEDYDVPDPIGQSAQVHQEVADLLDRDCSVIARALAQAMVPVQDHATSPRG